jgi:rhodanese-related sulfurtransferase
LPTSTSRFSYICFMKVKTCLTLLMFLSWGCLQTGTNAQTIQEINPDQFETLLKSNPKAVLIDVRTPEEYQEEHLKGAQNMDIHSPDFESKVKAIPTDCPIFLYCHSGRRSMEAANRLAHLGFQEIYVLKGGIVAWKSKQKPVTK